MDDLQKLGLRVPTHAPACHKHAPACNMGSIRMHPSTLAKHCRLIQSLQALQRKLLNNDLGHHTWPEAEQGQPPRLESCYSDCPPTGSSRASLPPQEGLLPPPSRCHPAPASQAQRCGSAPLPQPAHALVPQSSQQNSNPATQTAPTGSPRASLPPQEGLLPAARQLALLMEHFMGFFSCGFFSCVQVISSLYPPSSHYFGILCCLCCRYHTVWRLDGCLRVP